ncbi:hypothetical protein D9757_000491 [Collybiopsis confluens]|uniref:Carbonic anhydrase n=1 Tax=Collybiopsis confluens TaxID=2823264 RepID=A0A8H5I1L2_9AGAR|nr:hypothetical protein D9757_000491 [Collybiopsis confluens]
MDARIDVYKALGLQLGEAHVIRNAGGVARDAVRSILISQRLLGTREVAVIHHTDCGMLTFTAPDLRNIVKSDAKSRPANVKEAIEKAVDSLEIYEFGHLENSVKDDVKFLQDNLLVLDETEVTGWIFDVKTGKVSQVAQGKLEPNLTCILRLFMLHLSRTFVSIPIDADCEQPSERTSPANEVREKHPSFSDLEQELAT